MFGVMCVFCERYQDIKIATVQQLLHERIEKKTGEKSLPHFKWILSIQNTSANRMKYILKQKIQLHIFSAEKSSERVRPFCLLIICIFAQIIF